MLLMPLSHKIKTAGWQAETALINNYRWLLPHLRLLLLQSGTHFPAPWKCKKNYHCHHQMNCRPVVDNSWGTVEKQLCMNCTTNMQTVFKAAYSWSSGVYFTKLVETNIIIWRYALKLKLKIKVHVVYEQYTLIYSKIKMYRHWQCNVQST